MPVIAIPGNREVEFPDSMSEAEILTALDEILGQPEISAEVQSAEQPLQSSPQAVTETVTAPSLPLNGEQDVEGGVEEDGQEQANNGSIGGNIFSGLGEGLTRFTQGVEQVLREADIKEKETGQGGFLGFDPGNVLGDIEVQADQIAEAAEKAQEFKAKVLKDRENFDKSIAGSSTAGKVSVFLGETLPTLAVPGGVQGKIAQRILTGSLGGAAIGKIQFQEDEGEIGTGIGAALGGITPAVATLGKEVVKKVVPFLGAKTTDLIKKAGGDELLQSTLKRLESAKRLGLDLTPAEATGSGVLGKVQGGVGVSPKGAKLFESAGKKRVRDEQSAINSFLFDLSPEGSATNQTIRSNALKIIKDEEKALAKAAKPFYDASRGDLIPDDVLKELMKDPVIKNAYSQVMNVPAFQKELADAPINSIHFLDIVKRRLNDEASGATDQFGKFTNEGRIIGNSTRELVEAADAVSPNYRTARGIYSADAPAVAKLKGGVIGRIANMNDDQIKNVSKVLFDTSQTDIGVISKLSKRFADEDPAAWRKVIRNEMERRLDAVGKDRTATTFFDQILKKDRDFRLFLTATKGMPGTRKALIDMRRAFKDLIPPGQSAKGAAFRESQSLADPRNPLTAVGRVLAEKGFDKRDEVLTEIIINPQWHDELAVAVSEKAGRAGNIEKLSGLISKVAAGIGARELQ